MCMKASSAIKPRKPNKEGFCIGWKVVSKGFCSLATINIGMGRSFQYKIGENDSGASRYPDTSYQYDCVVKYGFHLFLKRDSARALKSYLYDKNEELFDAHGLKVIKVYYKPEDVKAYGRLEWNTDDPVTKVDDAENVVVYKLTVKSLKGE